MADLGTMPPANAYIDSNSLSEERVYPLNVAVCEQCLLAQVTDVIDPSSIFTQYAYLSSFSKSWLEHAKKYVDEIQGQIKLDSTSLVIEAASNDGYLLKNFVDLGIPVLGIEPAKNIAAIANEKGIRTLNCFLNSESGRDIAAEYGKAELLIGNNVLAHVPDIRSFVSGIKQLLKKDGIATFEFPHLLSLIEQSQFDTIYHEHYSYLSLLFLRDMFASLGLKVFDAKRLSTHGGSLRIFVCHDDNHRAVTHSLESLQKLELTFGLDKKQTYDVFKSNIEKIKQELLSIIQNSKKTGLKIAAYGAAAKGNTLLNYCGITRQDIDFVVDKNPEKQNKLLPGSHIPIWGEAALAEYQPDIILILPWNLKDEIIEQLAYCKEWGAQFIVPIPYPELI